MKRSMCGFVVLSAALAVASCGGDPTGDDIEQGQHVVADPSSLFVGEGESKFVTVELVDVLGNQLAADFEAQNVGPGITVEKDTTFHNTTIGTTLETSRRFIVTGVSGAATSFDLVSGGNSVTVATKVIPASLALTFSNPAPAANEEVTVTAEGFTFLPNAFLTFGADTAPTISVAEDGSSITILPPPGITAAPTVNNVEVNFARGAPLSIPATTELAVAPVTPLAGTSDPGTAPTIALPAIGETVRFFDAPDFVASADAFYKITVPAGVGGVTVTVNWNSAADVDLIEGNSACPTTFSPTDCNFAAATGAKPESATYALAPGTYFIIAELFTGTAPTNIYFEITTVAPAAP
jgi:hypothetical protein